MLLLSYFSSFSRTQKNKLAHGTLCIRLQSCTASFITVWFLFFCLFAWTHFLTQAASVFPLSIFCCTHFTLVPSQALQGLLRGSITTAWRCQLTWLVYESVWKESNKGSCHTHNQTSLLSAVNPSWALGPVGAQGPAPVLSQCLGQTKALILILIISEQTCKLHSEACPLRFALSTLQKLLSCWPQGLLTCHASVSFFTL